MFRFCVDFDQRRFPVEKMGFGQVDDLEDFDDLVELLHDLLDDPVIAHGDDGDHRGRRIQGRRNRQTFYVITSGAK
jgi:hypothetical protein